MDIKDLDKNQIVLAVVKSSKYNSEILATTKKLSKKKLYYVTLNKTYDALKEMLEKKKINMENIFFVDAISDTIKAVKDTKTVSYVSSPRAFTEMSIAITKALKKNPDYLLFDSLTSLMTYEKPAVIEKLFSNLVSKIRATKTKAIFYVVEIKEHEAMIKQCSMQSDKTIGKK